MAVAEATGRAANWVLNCVWDKGADEVDKAALAPREVDWHTSLKDVQHGKDEPGVRHEASQAQIATLEFTPEAMPLPQLLGRQVGNKGDEAIAAPKLADATLLDEATATKEALAAGGVKDAAGGA